MDNQQPDESISNQSAHIHHYVLKGSGLSCWAEAPCPTVRWRDAIAQLNLSANPQELPDA